MSRTIGGSMATHLAGDAHRLVKMLRLDLLDGSAIGVTEHDQDLTVNLGDGSLTYQAKTGVIATDVALLIGLEPSNYEVTGPISDLVTRTALEGGRFHMAVARLFEVHWSQAGWGIIPILKGHVSEPKIGEYSFTFGVRSAADRLNQVIGRLITPYCPGNHAECCAQIAPEIETTVVDVDSARQFTIDDAITAADFIQGRVTFTDGALAGVLPVEIFAVSGSTLTLFTELPEPPQVGDAVTVKEGCDLTRAMCRDRFANIEWFRGCPELPGTDQVSKWGIPANAGA